MMCKFTFCTKGTFSVIIRSILEIINVNLKQTKITNQNRAKTFYFCTSLLFLKRHDFLIFFEEITTAEELAFSKDGKNVALQNMENVTWAHSNL